MSMVPEQRRHGSTVVVVVHAADDSLQGVTKAAREARRRGLPLELVVRPGKRLRTRDQRAQHLQRLDAAVEVAHRAAPGLEVRVPYQAT